MRLLRYVGLADVVVVVMAAFIVLLPPRKMKVVWAADGDSARYSLALAEARTIDDASNLERDGALVAELVRRLNKVDLGDWAVEAGARGALAVGKAPSVWRALLATSVAYVDRLEAGPALEYAKRALAACAAARAVDERVCPAWEEVRMDFYTRHLQAGVDSGIDPKRDPRGFRRAGEAALRTIRVSDTPKPVTPTSPATAPAPTAPPTSPATAPAPAPTAPPTSPTTAPVPIAP